jgi:2-methylcitrate dehydratase PrpD
MTVDVTKELARFAAEYSFDEVPDDVVHEGKRAALNWAALALASAHHPVVNAVIAAATRCGAGGSSAVLGRSDLVPLDWAAAVHAASAHVEDYDDTHLATLIHVGAPVYSAVFSVAEAQGVNGKDALYSAILGSEVALRVGMAMGIEHWRRGNHLTATCGAVGAAAGVSRVLGLNVKQTMQAIGIVSTSASGVLATLGTDTKAWNAANAARDGVVAALLASEGFTGPTLEADKGFVAVGTPEPHLDVLAKDLGQWWEFRKNTYKPYACGIVGHPAIEGVLDLRDELLGKFDSIEGISVAVHSSVIDLMANPTPVTGLEGKFSVPHCVAVALADGLAGIDQYSDARVNDREVVSLRSRVTLVSDESVEKDAARLDVTFHDGSVLRAAVEHVTGSDQNPMSDERLEQKALELTKPFLGEQGAEAFIKSVWDIDTAATIGDWIREAGTVEGANR